MGPALSARLPAVATLALALGSCGSQVDSELAKLEWLLGEWASDDGVVTESWRAISAKTFEGVGTTTVNGKTSREDLRLVYMGEGIFYIAKVAHNEFPVAFRLTGDAAAVPVVFENPTHDFPVRIEYRQDGDDAMVVAVSDGGSEGFQISFSRVR